MTARRVRLAQRFRRWVADHAGRVAVRMDERAAVNAIASTGIGGQGGYAAARSDRHTEGWVTRSVSADADLLPDLDTLRSRSRELIRNNSDARGVIEGMCREVVGTGIRPQSSPDEDDSTITEEQAKAFKRAAERVWRRWGPTADVTGRNTIADLQRLAFRKILEDGEVFLNLVNLDAPGRPFYLAVEVIEAHLVSTPMSKQAEGLRIRDGIELDEWNRAVAIWVERGELSDAGIDQRSAMRAMTWRRIPTMDARGKPLVLHLYRQDRPNQTRGEPLFAAAVSDFKTSGDWIEAELLAKRIESCFAGFITSELGLSPHGTARTQTGTRIDELEPAMIEYLRPGEKVEFANPTRPGNNFAPFVERIFRSIANGTGIPYEVAFQTFGGMNYSNARVVLLAARRAFQWWQQFLAAHLCAPIWGHLLDEAFLRQKLGAISWKEDREALLECRWLAQGWPWVDPQKEVTASTASVEAGFQTKADIIAALSGGDFEQVARQRAREKEIERELGLEAKPVASAPGQEPPPDPDDEDEDEEGEDEEGQEDQAEPTDQEVEDAANGRI